MSPCCRGRGTSHPMGLAQILYPPPTKQGLEEWFLAHARQHDAIVDALKETRGIILPAISLYPVNEGDMDDWLQRHQEAHTAMNRAVGVSGTDLTGLDLKHRDRSDVWFFQHFLQHQGVAQLCGRPI